MKQELKNSVKLLSATILLVAVTSCGGTNRRDRPITDAQSRMTLASLLADRNRTNPEVQAEADRRRRGRENLERPMPRGGAQDCSGIRALFCAKTQKENPKKDDGKKDKTDGDGNGQGNEHEDSITVRRNDRKENWEQLCEADKISTREGGDADGDGIRQVCDDYLRDKLGYQLAGDDSPNGWLVTVRKLSLENLKTMVTQGNARLDESPLKTEINKILENNKSLLEKLRLAEKKSFINQLIASRIAISAVEHRDTEMIAEFIAQGEEIPLREPTVPLSDFVSLSGKLTSLWGGKSARQALISNPFRGDREFRFKDLNGVLGDISGLTENDLFVYSAEALVSVPTEVELAIGNLANLAARPVGMIFLQMNNEVGAIKIDEDSLTGRGAVTAVLNQIREEINPIERTNNVHVKLLLVGTEVSRQEANLPIADIIVGNFEGSEGRSVFPQHIATYKGLTVAEESALTDKSQSIDSNSSVISAGLKGRLK